MATQQPDSWMDHKYLALMKGIGATPTDNLSAENPIASISLLTGAVSLTLDGWTPQIPTVKNGGVWSDSPISDGRQLLAAPVGNITEKMTVIVKGNSYLAAQQNFVALGQMAADCRDYWQGIAQIDPVYLMWAAGCNIPALPQYALLYNIELAPEYLDGPTPSIRVAMTLERESYWRGLPPGANPKLWTFYVNNQAIGLGSKVLADATLVTGTDHLITQTINNKFEWSPTAYGLQTTPITQNYIDITAAQIPGDAPALVELSLTADTAVPANFYIGKSTKKFTNTGHDNISRAMSLILTGGDSNSTGGAVKTVGTIDTGVKSNGSSVNFTFVNRTVTGVDGGYVGFAQWAESGTGGLIKLDREVYRGTFAIFARCSNASAAPVATDMQIRVFIEEFENNNANQYVNSITLPVVNPPIAGASYQLAYMGTVTLPLSNRAVQSVNGYGVQIQNSLSNLRITLQQQVLVATANRSFNFVDLILMPVDEGLAQIPLILSTLSTTGVTIFDNTGYLGRGDTKQSAVAYVTNADTGGVTQEVRGADVMLKPRTNQRLYFIADSWLSGIGTQNLSVLKQTIGIRLNIVPRWSGIRDT